MANSLTCCLQSWWQFVWPARIMTLVW